MRYDISEVPLCKDDPVLDALGLGWKQHIQTRMNAIMAIDCNSAVAGCRGIPIADLLDSRSCNCSILAIAALHTSAAPGPRGC
jgi:hypothetical protein